MSQKRKTVYISGAMTGKFALNFKEFYRKQIAFEELGFEVVNPAENDAEHWRMNGKNRTWDECLQEDERLIEDQADIIFMMKGWRRSKGAKRELAKAQELNLEVWYE